MGQLSTGFWPLHAHAKPWAWHPAFSLRSLIYRFDFRLIQMLSGTTSPVHKMVLFGRACNIGKAKKMAQFVGHGMRMDGRCVVFDDDRLTSNSRNGSSVGIVDGFGSVLLILPNLKDVAVRDR